MRLIIFLIFAVQLTTLVGCTKFVELDPPADALTDETAYRSDATATSVMTGLYQTLTANTDFAGGDGGLSVLTGLQTDELKYYISTPDYLQFATSSLMADNPRALSVWSRAYKTIYGANAVAEGVTNSTTLSAAVKDQLIGEARFMRAFMYFYLVNLYGKVPLALTTNYELNTTLHRSEINEVYQQIIQDLQEAQGLLKNDYLSAQNTVTADRVRPNRTTATALLARVYLYTGDWVNAEASATEVIDQSAVYVLEENLDQVFLASSMEAIWQLGLGPNSSGINTWEGYVYKIHFSPVGGYPGITLSDTQIEVMEDDNRLLNWTTNYSEAGTDFPYAFKYKVFQAESGSTPTELQIVLRLAEQRLIRAEARAMQGRLAGADGAIADLNAVRERAGEFALAPADLPQFMLALEKERQIELFTEWGHRWLDMKRWKGFNNPGITRADEIMPAVTAAKGGTWTPDYKLWPIPEKEISANVNLDQNDGYSN